MGSARYYIIVLTINHQHGTDEKRDMKTNTVTIRYRCEVQMEYSIERNEYF